MASLAKQGWGSSLMSEASNPEPGKALGPEDHPQWQWPWFHCFPMTSNPSPDDPGETPLGGESGV